MQALPANKAPNLAKVLLNFKPKLHFNADDSRQIVFKPGVGIKKRSEENLPLLFCFLNLTPLLPVLHGCRLFCWCCLPAQGY